MFGDVFVGRVDCKAHRKSGVFELVHLHLENTEIDLSSWLTPFLKTLHRFVHFNHCQSIIISRISPPKQSNTIHEFINHHWDETQLKDELPITK